ncbi:MAG: squalene synthase HpnD [Chloroflexi bacterium]|nr:squalene synthase HpnD [Chloroflexota bacterium]|tara:strand:- start:30782 stop:31660 length:879 start_codon:yes stop_codon:yes gene_type:complete
MYNNNINYAYKYCEDITKQNAKNFYYAFKLLPKPKRLAIYATYAFCRICDDIVDSLDKNESKLDKLDKLKISLININSKKNHNPIFLALSDAITKFNIPKNYYLELILGVQSDISKHRFNNFNELSKYCYQVASVVGLICIEIFGYKDSNAKKLAIELGYAMQITNILRDLKEDLTLGRIYIPLDEINKFNYSEDELLKSLTNDNFKLLMKFQAERAQKYYTNSKPLFNMINKDSRACIELMHHTYNKILNLIIEHNFNVFDQRIKISKFEKTIIFMKLWKKNITNKIMILQ